MTLILQGTDNSVSSPAVQGGTAGATTGIYYPSTNQVAIASGGSKAIVVSQSNITNFYNNNNLRLYTTNEGNYGFLRNSGSGSSNSVELGANGVVIKVDDNYNATFYNSGAAQKTIITANNGIGIGGATPSSGTGIAFPATQDPSSDANTLDDYEEGSWTPQLTDGTTTVNAPTNVYVKVGQLVFLQFFFYNVNLSGFGTGAITFKNFPFTINPAVAVDACFIAATTSNLPVLMDAAGTSGTLYQGSSGPNVNVLTKANFNSASTASLWGQFCYRCSA